MMELVYLWVEEYKNIKKQGFNFSPRFKCEFKDKYDENSKLKDNCELIIEENKDYVNIFPKDINITAIVGENGSGKSSILEIIANKHEEYNHQFSQNIIKFFTIYFLDKTIYIVNDNYNKNINCKQIIIPNINCINYKILNIHEEQTESNNKSLTAFDNLTSVFYSDILNKLNINLKNKENNSNTPFPKNISTSSMLNNIKPTHTREKHYGDYSKTGFQQIYSSYEIHQLILVIMLLKDSNTITLPFTPPKK